MSKRKPLTDNQGEVREITAVDLNHAMRFDQLPESMQTMFRTRGPQKAPTKERITIRLSREVVEYFRSTGEGWQTRMDEAMLKLVHKRKSV